MVVDKVVGIVVERSLVEMADNLELISNHVSGEKFI